MTVPLVRPKTGEYSNRTETALVQVFVPAGGEGRDMFPVAPPRRIVVWSHPPCHRVVEINEKVEAEAMLTDTEDAVHVVVSEIPSTAVCEAFAIVRDALAALQAHLPT